MEYSMYPQLIYPLTQESKAIISGSTTVLNYYSLSAVQKIAEALGDGFFAEKVQNQNGIKIQNPWSSGVLTVNADESIPVLRHLLYGFVGMFFVVNYYSITNASQIGVQFINIATGDLLSSCKLHGGANGNNGQLCVINASRDRKMLCSYVASGYGEGSLILAENGIIHNQFNNNDKIAQVRGDGQVSVLTHSATIANAGIMQMIPFLDDTYPTEELPGIYVMSRMMGNKPRENFLYDGTMYFSPGTSITIPMLVISDET